MKIDAIQIGILTVLFLAFLYAPFISDMLGHSLDTMPMRLAAVLLILAPVQYDMFISIGAFLAVTAIYIQHHQNDLNNLVTPGRVGGKNVFEESDEKHYIDRGGHSNSDIEEIDYMPQKEDQDNEFVAVTQSMDEKKVLLSDSSGSRSQSMFDSEMRNAESLAMSNRNGFDE